MKRRIWAMAFALIAVCVWPPRSLGLPDETGNYEKLGVGNLECENWTQARRSGDVFAVWWKTLILGWVQGYVSAFNLYNPNIVAIHRSADIAIMADWVDTYCQEHPANDIADAAEAVVSRLNGAYKSPVPGNSPNGK